jgi:hypothetical protein
MTAIVKIASIALIWQVLLWLSCVCVVKVLPDELYEEVDGAEEVKMDGRAPVLELEIRERMRMRR